MRSPGGELKKASSRRGYLHPFKSFSTSHATLRVEPSPERPDKPKKESRSFFSQLRRSFTLGHGSSSSAAAATPRHATAAAPVASMEGTHVPGPWGRRVKNGLSKPLKVVRTSYVDCMMGIAEDHRMEGAAAVGFQHSCSDAYAFQASASRHYQRSSSSAAPDGVSDAQLQDFLRSSKRVLSSE